MRGEKIIHSRGNPRRHPLLEGHRGLVPCNEGRACLCWEAVQLHGHLLIGLLEASVDLILTWCLSFYASPRSPKANIWVSQVGGPRQTSTSSGATVLLHAMAPMVTLLQGLSGSKGFIFLTCKGSEFEMSPKEGWYWPSAGCVAMSFHASLKGQKLGDQQSLPRKKNTHSKLCHSLGKRLKENHLVTWFAETRYHY